MQLMDFLIFVYERMAKNSKNFNVTIDIISKGAILTLQDVTIVVTIATDKKQ